MKVNALFTLQTTLTKHVLSIWSIKRGKREKIKYEEWDCSNKFNLVRLEQFWDRWRKVGFLYQKNQDWHRQEIIYLQNSREAS